MRGRSEQGFVLVIVLMLLVVLSLLASSAAASAQRAVSEAQIASDLFQSDLDTASTEQTLLYMLATQRRTLAGLAVDDIQGAPSDDSDDPTIVMPIGNEIRLDGTTYAGIGSTRFSIQDDRGLLSLNWTPPLMRNAYYAAHAIPQERWADMDDLRLDYQDADDLRRLNGAEAPHYEREGRRPPANRAVTTPLEFRSILGWDRMLADVDDSELATTLSLARSIDLNINTAPAANLALVPGMDRAQAERLVSLRQRVPFLSVAAALKAFPIAPAAEEMLNVFPSQSGNLILWDRHRGARRLVHWTLTPFQEGGPPWRIDYEITLPRGAQLDPAVVGTPDSPLFSATRPVGQ